MKRLSLIALATLLIVAPATAQSPIKDRLARAGQGELVAGDGPTYRAILSSGEVLLLTVAGDGRATLMVTDKAGKAEPRPFTNRQLDALDEALKQAGFDDAVVTVSQTCKAGEIIFETIIDGRYRNAVQCEGGPLDRAVALLRSR